MALPPGLVEKRRCGFDWSEVKNDEKFSDEYETDTDYAAMPPLETEEEYLKS